MRKYFEKERVRFKRIVLHPTFILLTILGNLILLSSSVALYFFERGINPNIQNLFDAFWWGVATITTVGFGDIVPVTNAGKVIGIVLMYTGTVLFISFIGILVSLWMQEEVEREIFPLEKEIKEEERETIQVEQLLLEIRDRLDRLERDLGNRN
jgi:voltage-gated potassium channel